MGNAITFATINTEPDLLARSGATGWEVHRREMTNHCKIHGVMPGDCACVGAALRRDRGWVNTVFCIESAASACGIL